MPYYTCHVCCKTFKSMKRFEDHHNTTHKGGKYECHKCKQAFVSKASRDAHLKKDECRKR